MSTVDVSRFAHGLHAVFAPAVLDGQVFYAFLNKQNSITVQADNILKQSAENVDLSTVLADIHALLSTHTPSSRESIHLYIHLDNGCNDEGEVLTIPIPLGPLNHDTFDQSKALAIVNALAPLFSKSVYCIDFIDEHGSLHRIA